MRMGGGERPLPQRSSTSQMSTLPGETQGSPSLSSRPSKVTAASASECSLGPWDGPGLPLHLSLIHISEPTRH